ncbi:MAG: PorV/PorQ family protein [Flavobacteriales bacterium]|nr:PorV/PorQ family protein [Flavobacteriales bacterium]
MNEINYALGMEYWYNKQFAIRAGYFWEAATKGNRKFFTLGAGLRYNVFGLDFSYLIPAYFGSSAVVNNPLKNTLRFSLTFDFEGLKSLAEPAESISE